MGGVFFLAFFFWSWLLVASVASVASWLLWLLRSWLLVAPGGSWWLLVAPAASVASMASMAPRAPRSYGSFIIYRSIYQSSMFTRCMLCIRYTLSLIYLSIYLST